MTDFSGGSGGRHNPLTPFIIPSSGPEISTINDMNLDAEQMLRFKILEIVVDNIETFDKNRRRDLKSEIFDLTELFITYVKEGVESD